MAATQNDRAKASSELGGKDALELWVVPARAFAAVEKQAAADAGRHGLTLTEFGVLEVLYHKGPLRLCEIQRQILVSSGGVTYLVDRLEAQRVVKRRPHPRDRRAVRLELTPRGRRFIQTAFVEHAERLTEVLSGLDAREGRQAIGLLRKLGHHAAALIH